MAAESNGCSCGHDIEFGALFGRIEAPRQADSERSTPCEAMLSCMSPGAEVRRTEAARFWRRGAAGRAGSLVSPRLAGRGAGSGPGSPSLRQSRRGGVRVGRRGPRRPAVSPAVLLSSAQPGRAFVGPAGHVSGVAEFTAHHRRIGCRQLHQQATHRGHHSGPRGRDSCGQPYAGASVRRSRIREEQ